MDPAVALVRAYLHVNGYFTVTEYPVLEALEAGGYRTMTDLDVLAFRFPGAGRRVGGSDTGLDAFEPDPELGADPGGTDMIVAEVKEGRAALNRASTEPDVLRAALVRFGCCPASEVNDAVEGLQRDGRVRLPGDRVVRLVAFGLPPAEEIENARVVTLGHVTRFLRDYLDEYWDALHHAESKDPAMGVLMALEKAEREEAG
ncbi:MAG: hypothetical protein R3326_09370 [Gemmatimonadota bacterium]|nr:hypothetical protein [Gemmatimonadota bacterium]